MLVGFEGRKTKASGSNIGVRIALSLKSGRLIAGIQLILMTQASSLRHVSGHVSGKFQVPSQFEIMCCVQCYIVAEVLINIPSARCNERYGKRETNKIE